jgi:hypothetical protein
VVLQSPLTKTCHPRGDAVGSRRCVVCDPKRRQRFLTGPLKLRVSVPACDLNNREISYRKFATLPPKVGIPAPESGAK